MNCSLLHVGMVSVRSLNVFEDWVPQWIVLFRNIVEVLECEDLLEEWSLGAALEVYSQAPFSVHQVLPDPPYMPDVTATRSSCHYAVLTMMDKS